MSINLSLADAVAASITALELGVVASVSLYSELDREAIEGLQIEVLSDEGDVAAYSRKGSEWELPVTVVFSKLVTDDSEVGGLLAIADQVMEHFARAPSLLIDGRNHHTGAVRRDSLFDQALLKDDRVFQSVIKIEFKVVR